MSVFVFFVLVNYISRSPCLAFPQRGDAFVKRLTNKIAIVTGASRVNGIGTAICRELAREGADIFFTHWSKYDRMMNYFIEDDSDWSQHLMKEIRSLGVRCESMELDLSQPDAQGKLLDEVHEKLGSPSILVNNATHSRARQIT